MWWINKISQQENITNVINITDYIVYQSRCAYRNVQIYAKLFTGTIHNKFIVSILLL